MKQRLNELAVRSQHRVNPAGTDSWANPMNRIVERMRGSRMRSVIRAVAARGRRVLRATLAVIATGVFVVLATGSAAAQPTPAPAPAPISAAPQPAPGPGPAALNELIDPALLESLQPSIVGLVTI